MKKARSISKLAVIAVIVLAAVNIFLSKTLYSSQPHSEEVSFLEGKNYSFKELINYFTLLANKKGAVFAFNVLKSAPIPPNTDIHLLGHVIGDILYEQQGARGILSCTQDFRNACSHTIVIGTLLEKGPGAIQEIVDLCGQAPGGSGAYTMCFHGLGHGVLAYNEYELPAAVEMCAKTKTKGGEDIECIGGTIMEMIAGVHDPEIWQEKKEKYFKESDPLYPCSAAFIPESAKVICYTYLTPHLFESAGADLGRPLPEEFKKAFTFCESLSGGARRACFGGFGKEFIVLAQNRDVRAIDKMSEDQFATVIGWCSLSVPSDGKQDCVIDAMRSVFWGGENDPGASVNFCLVAAKNGLDEPCFDDLVHMFEVFIHDNEKRSALCDLLPSSHKDICHASA
jgi:hypothetical protein